jgi:hypothetical protein
MTVAENDVLTPTDLALKAFSRAHERKESHIIPGGHLTGTQIRISRPIQADKFSFYARICVSKRTGQAY